MATVRTRDAACNGTGRGSRSSPGRTSTAERSGLERSGAEWSMDGQSQDGTHPCGGASA
jgi:hypothetical protein